jgi:electron transfer flavoprotein alpha subunit
VSTLVFLEHHEGEFVKNSLGVLSKAASLGGEVHGVATGTGVRELAANAGAYGAAKAWFATPVSPAAPA